MGPLTTSRAETGGVQAGQVGLYAWWVVLILSVGNIVSALDRQIINLLVEPLKAAFRLSDEQVSLLQGFAIAAFFALMAVPLSRMADRGNRRNLILVGAVLWSLATSGCGLAGSYMGLFLARMFVGVGEATLAPAGFSIVGDYFPRHDLARPLSVFTGAGFLGSGIALVAGGALFSWLHRHHGLQIAGVVRLADWQATFVLAALPGLVFALMMFSVREPLRHGIDVQADTIGIGDVLRFLRGRAGLFAPLFLGFSVLAAGQYALGSWIPSFFIRTYHWAPGAIGMSYGLLVALGGTLGVVAGGFICDRLKAKGWSAANLWVAIGASAAAIPFAATFPLASDPRVALALIVPLTVLGPMPFGAGTAVIPTVTPNLMRAQVVAFYLFVANLLGVGGGPWLVALVTDHVVRNPSLIRYSLAAVGPAILLVGVVLLSLALRPLRAALRKM